MVASVIICTYNRPQLLYFVLRRLTSQILEPSIEWEILVIDNDPLFTAKPIVTKIIENSPTTVHYIHESNVGLSYARNRGIDESTGDILLFLDDDALPIDTWLEGMLTTFSRTGADCVGGRVLVLWDGEPDESVRSCELDMVAFDKGPLDFPFRKRRVPIGANLAFQRKVFVEGLRFPTDLGRVKSNLMGGEEVEVILDLHKRGKKISYSAKGLVFHVTGGERLFESFYFRRAFWNGFSSALIDIRQCHWSFVLGKSLILISKSYIFHLACWLIADSTGHSRVRLLVGSRLVKNLGYVAGVLKWLTGGT